MTNDMTYDMTYDMTHTMKRHTDNGSTLSSLFRQGGVKTLVMMLLMLMAAGVGEVAAQEPAGVQIVEEGKPYRIRTTMIEGMQLSTKKNTVRGGDAIGIFMTDYFAKDQIFYFEATSTNYFIKDAEGKYVNSNDSKTYAGNFLDDDKYKYAIEAVNGTDYVKFKCAGSYYLAPGRGFVNGSPVYGDGDKERHNTNTKTMVLWKIIPWDPVADFKVLIDAVATYKDNDATLSAAYTTALNTYNTYKDTPIADMLGNTGSVLTTITNGISALTTARDKYLQSLPLPTPGDCYIAWSHDTDKLLTRPNSNSNATLTTPISANNKMTLESDGTNYYIKNGDYYLAVKGTRAVTYGTNYDTGGNVLTTEWKTSKDDACKLNIRPYGNGHFGIQFKKFDNYSTTSSTGGYLDPGPCTDLSTLYPLREDGITNPLGYWTFKLKAPSIIYNPDTNTATISCSTPGATIYYAMGDADVVVSTDGEGYSGSVTTAVLDQSVTTIKAVSKLGDIELSSNITIPFQTTAGTNERPYLIQQYNNRWNDDTIIYYMIPDSDNGTANTTNVPRPTMEWFIKYESTESGTVYYSLVNKVTGEYLYYDNTQTGGNSKGIFLKASNKYSSSDNGFKFRITPYDTNYNIVPYGLTSGSMYVHKGSSNTSKSPVTLNNSQNNANSLWNFVPRSALDLTPPFTAATETCAPYYKLNCVGDNTLYITPPTTGTNVVMSTTADNTVDWYLEEAQAATESDWNTYYYIRHGLTGQYLYYAGGDKPNNDQCFQLKSSVTTGDESRYMFTWVRYHTTDQYQIVPHFLLNVVQDQTSSIRRDGNQLKAGYTRDNSSSAWTFVEATDMKVATPVFVYDDVQQQFSITCATPGAKIYYKGYNEGEEVPTFTFPDDLGTLYTGPFDKGAYENYVAVAARCIDDGSDHSDLGYGNTESLKYRYHIIDKSHHEVIAVGSNDETLGLPVAYQSPLVTHYHYHTAANITNNIPTGSEMTSLNDLEEGEKDIYVTYDVSARIKLDGSQYYMLRYENPKGSELWEEVSDLPQGFPANTKHKVYYPYTNGKEGFNLYGDEKKDAVFGDGESTRTRFLWYFEGGDPYRIKIHSFNTADNSKYHAGVGPYASYFYTFYGNGGSTDTGHTDAATHTVLTQTDRGDLTPENSSDDLPPTEYMILNGHGSSSSFPYRLLTSSKIEGKYREVSTFEHQWLNSSYLDMTDSNREKYPKSSIYASHIGDWYQMPELGGFTKTHADHTNLWYETVDMGSNFSIEQVTLYPVLHLVDNHGWDIAHWTMDNTEVSKNKIKQFNSPLVKEYRWYKGEAQTGKNKAITKETGYYKYYINTATPCATTTDLTSDWSFVNFENVAENYNFYVFYDAKDNFNNGNLYLFDLGGKLAELNGSAISYVKNGADYHANGILNEGVTLTNAMQWKVAFNTELDTENAYTGKYDYSNKPESGKDAGRFDPYSLRIETSVGSNYYTVNSSYNISLTDGQTTQFEYKDRADLMRANKGTTFMAVQGTDGKMRLVLRNSDHAEQLNRALDRSGAASETAAATAATQTAVLIPLRQNLYTIVRKDGTIGTPVISSTGYTSTLQVPDDIASPLLDNSYYTFYSSLEDAVADNNRLTDQAFAALDLTAPVYVRYDVTKQYSSLQDPPIDLSGATSYTMRNGSQYLYYESDSPAFTTNTPTDADLDNNKYKWTFTGNDPYHVTIKRGDYQMANTFIWLGSSTYGWNFLENTAAVNGQYNYLYRDSKGQSLLHREALGATTAADNIFVEQYEMEEYTYHIINRAGTEAIKYTIKQRSVTPLSYDNLPEPIRSPFIADETLTFYSNDACTTAITTAGQATSSDNDIYVKYTTNQLSHQRLDLTGASSYKMRVSGAYVYDDNGSLAIGDGTETEYWLLTGNDPYAVEIKSQTGNHNHTISYDTSGPSLSIDGSDSKFILLSGNAGTYVELMAATGADVANEAYYNLGLVSNSPTLCSSDTYKQGNAALQVNFSKVNDSGTETVLEIAYSSDMKANLAGRYKAMAGFVIDETIGTSETPFTGEFDGDFQEISSATMPLFDTVDGAVIKNVIFGSVNISGGDNVGAIANVATGRAEKITSIYNCGILSNSSSVSRVIGNGNVGGLVGCLGSKTDDAKCYARVINCYSYADVTSGSGDNAYAAGIVGYNSYASTNTDLRTMVMNCMFYGNVTDGKNISPVYGGQIINNNSATGLNNFNYFSADDFKDFSTRVTAFNCALGAEKRFLTRFEFYRHILNSNLPLAAWYATGNTEDYAIKMAKWVLESADRTISNPKPYPDLRRHGERALYPSIINIDAAHAGAAGDRNKGGRLGTLNVTISGTGSGAPAGAEIITSSLSLNITDKDEDRFNFNYYKVQLPYYNQVGTGNYTHNKVVTGWKITSISGGTPGTFTTGADATKGDDGTYSTPYNFADRDCINKDLYSVSGRVFSQGAYFDVPNGVTAITIEPYWAMAAYLADPCYDKTYSKDFGNNAYDINPMGGTRYTNGQSVLINGSSQLVYTSMGNAIDALRRTSSSSSIYENAVVLIGNYHHYYGNSSIINDKMGFTIMSADLDLDNEPDNCFIYQHTNRLPVSPIRFDFLCWSGIGMAQKPSNSTRMPDIGIFKPRGWFEVTNTCLTKFYQFEYDWSTKNADQDGSPLILLGGIYEQIVSSNDGAPTHTKYIHLGSNVWFKMFNNGIHADKNNFTPHNPISVTGGDYDKFYLSGMFRPDATADADNAECYISGGRFGEVAGAGMEKINGNVYWQIDHADIEAFYGGGINAAQPVQGDITTDITNSNVTTFCGGPKFGDMVTGKKVTTTASGCTFGQYFGAGYGGTSLNRIRKYNLTNSRNYNFNSSWVSSYSRAYETSTKTTPNGTGGPTNDITVNAIATNYEYELFPYSGFANDNNVGRFYVNYASVSLATTGDVTSTLTGCTINGDFYGGGNLGKVNGNISSTLTDCAVTGSVYGAGFSAAAPTVDVMNKEGFSTEPFFDGNSGFYIQGVYPASVPYTWAYDPSKATGNNVFDDTKHIIYTNVNFPAEGGTVTGNVTLNITGSQTNITGDVYGGGALASSNTSYATDNTTTTTVNLMGGRITGDVYGGGQGRLASGDEEAVEALVGNTMVRLNGMSATDYAANTAAYSAWGLEQLDSEDQTSPWISGNGCIVTGTGKGRIFGCNNLNGTPKGTATVHVYKTNGAARTTQANLDAIDDSKHRYHLAAVYGGGNLAAYVPTKAVSGSDAEKKSTFAHVIIEGCDMTSIKTVYGGGNAASAPATKVDVIGTYEIEEVFGGGNGKDAITIGSETKPNPGANVGFYDYSAVEETYDTKDKRQDEEFVGQYVYGSGEANVNIYGGRIHRVFGGSNTKGNVRIVAVTMLDNEDNDCEFVVDEAYGGGKSAPMDGAANLIMACIPGLKAAYGGAEEANINSDVKLTITNGTFDRVFGGNNVSGTITGKIEVNIEETGCRPVVIGQLYGGGNQAPYTAPWKDDNDHTKGRQDGPTLNVRSFTSIGEVYGGGYGATAVVTGDTHVNINVTEGRYAGDAYAGETKTISFTEYVRDAEGEFEMETIDDEQVRKTEDREIELTLPGHEAGKIGAIGNVYGGGNAAEVDGNTFVNIGTTENEIFVTPTTKTTTTGEGNEATTTETETTDAERTHTVKGADIRGNVYGGGNAATVTGNTNVVVGK